MRVLVDLLFMTGSVGGKESYVQRLYPEMARLEPEIEWIALCPDSVFDSVRPWFPGRIIRSAEMDTPFIAWPDDEIRRVPAAADRLGADLLHCPADIGPRRSPVPMLLTLHDALPFAHPEWVIPPPGPVELQTLIRESAAAAWHIITDSDSARCDLVRELAVEGRISVVPLAGSGSAVPGITPRGGGILVPGRRAPNKDAETVIRALSMIPAGIRPHATFTGSTPDDPLRPLVAELGLDADVTLEGWLDQPAIEVLFDSAAVMVLPSLFEGFGLPILEAMERGCPVICSDLPVLREVGGGAAMYAEPGDPAAFASAIRRMLTADGERERRAAAGVARARRFSWERTARRTLDIIRAAPVATASWIGPPR